MKTLRIIAVATVAALSALTLAACAPASTQSDKFQIVASTNVWGDVAKQVGGDLVEVTSLIDNSNKDPHSYEATARDQLAIEKADLVVSNGGGYDDFIEKLSAAAGNKPEFRVASAVTAVDWQQNEHLWYSAPAVAEVAFALATAIGSLDTENATTYEANAKAFVDELGVLGKEIGDLRKITQGYTYFGTEPLAVWLMADLGFVDKTPEEFAEAIENETDVPPATMKESLDLINSGTIKYLVINGQTENSQTKQIVDAASQAGVKAVVLSEILTDGQSYIQWMSSILKTINPGT
jgi:zinc/manganese transport system substrate-binding protein